MSVSECSEGVIVPRPETHQEYTLIIAWIIEMVKKYGHATTKDFATMFGLHLSTAEKFIRVATALDQLTRMDDAV